MLVFSFIRVCLNCTNHYKKGQIMLWNILLHADTLRSNIQEESPHLILVDSCRLIDKYMIEQINTDFIDPDIGFDSSNH